MIRESDNAYPYSDDGLVTSLNLCPGSRYGTGTFCKFLNMFRVLVESGV